MKTSGINEISSVAMRVILGSAIIVALFFASTMYADAAVQLSFRGEPSTIEKAQYVALVWGAINAKECSAGGGWSGAYRTAGTISIQVSETTVFSMSCAGADGSIDSKNITITVGETLSPPPPPAPPIPAVTITASKNNITSGETVLLSWSSTSAQNCLASNGWSGTKNISGQEYIAPVVTSTYTIVCTNGFASTSDFEFIQVNAVLPPPLSPPPAPPFTVACVTSPNPVKVNQQVTFAAGSTGGITPITYEWSGVFSGSGLSRTISFSNAGIKTVTVTATDSIGKKTQASCSVEVISAPPPPVPVPKSLPLPPPPAPVVAEDDDARCIARGYIKKDSEVAKDNSVNEAVTKNERSRLAALVLGEYIPLPLLFLLYLFAVGGVVVMILIPLAKRLKQKE